MDLPTRLTDDLKAAMKSGEKDRLGVIRMLLNEVKNRDLGPNRSATPEQAVEAYAKKLRKSVEEYEKLGKPDETAKLRAEMAVVDGYLPKKLSPAETEPLVDAFLAGHAFTDKQVGQATGAFMKQHGPTADAGVVNGLMRKKLAP